MDRTDGFPSRDLDRSTSGPASTALQAPESTRLNTRLRVHGRRCQPSRVCAQSAARDEQVIEYASQTNSHKRASHRFRPYTMQQTSYGHQATNVCSRVSMKLADGGRRVCMSGGSASVPDIHCAHPRAMAPPRGAIPPTAHPAHRRSSSSARRLPSGAGWVRKAF